MLNANSQALNGNQLVCKTACGIEAESPEPENANFLTSKKRPTEALFGV